MAATKISALAEITANDPLDELAGVDVSDTSMAASGTSKFIKVGTLFLPARFSQTSNASPTDGDVWYGSTQKALAAQLDGMTQRFVGAVFTQSVDGSAVTNTTTETSIVGTGIGSLTLPANFFVAGKMVRVQARGTWAGAASSGNVSIKVKVGTLSVSTSALVVSAHGTMLWEADWLVLCKSTGATGAFVINGHMHWYSSATAMSPCAINTTGTLDTTASQAIDETVTWTAANATNTITQNQMLVEALN